MIDKLIEKIEQLQNPTAVGLDTSFDYLTDDVKARVKTAEDAGKSILEFNVHLIDKLSPYVPAVKVQIAYYEYYGIAGLTAFQKTVEYAKSKGLIVIADAKRNDIGSTAACYSKAYLGKNKINDLEFTPFNSDFLTVNGYLGGDGIQPFVDDCKKFCKGIFVLVKTSNPGSGQLQDKKFEDGRTLYEAMGDLVEEWGESTRGKYGYSSVGAVVGATHPAQAENLRQRLPHTFFLIPGYGAQGGSADGLAVCFDKMGRGGIVNNSRGIICAYKTDKYKSDDYAAAALNAVTDMREDLYRALKRAGKTK